MRRNAFLLVLLAVGAHACGGSEREPPAAEPASPSPSSEVSPSASATHAPSPSAEPTAPPAAIPDGVPATFDEDVPARDLPVEELIPPGDEVTGVDLATFDGGEAVVIAFATPGPDPFLRARGFVVWRRQPEVDPPWRAVYGLAHGKRDGVLAISADTTDLTDDGTDEALLREDTGGSGACATYRVVDLAAGEPIWKRSLCDAEVQPNPDPIGLYLVERVYTADDPHCCPSAISERVLAWRDGRFVVISEQVTDL